MILRNSVSKIVRKRQWKTAKDSVRIICSDFGTHSPLSAMLPLKSSSEVSSPDGQGLMVMFDAMTDQSSGRLRYFVISPRPKEEEKRVQNN